MTMALDRPAALSPRRPDSRAARAIGRCLLGIGPISAVLAIVDRYSDDLDGLVSAQTLERLVSLLGGGTLDRQALEVSGIRHVTPHDHAAARRCGGALKPVVSAAVDDGGAQAFVGPAFLSTAQPLAHLEPGLSGIRLDGRHGSHVFWCGPDLGRITGNPTKGLPPHAVNRTQPIATTAPVTSWFARVSFPGVVPPSGACASLIGAIGISVEGIADYAFGNSRWLLIGSHNRAEIDAAARRLAEIHRIETVFFRRLSSACARDARASYGGSHICEFE
jgi:hypothetical protein